MLVSAPKDPESEHPVPTAWRGTLKEIVHRLVTSDMRGVADVEGLTADFHKLVAANIKAYGATLIELPDETWNSSICQWSGSRWDVIVDLWTQEEGRSDLVLQCKVTESNDGYRYKVHLVYVP